MILYMTKLKRSRKKQGNVSSEQNDFGTVAKVALASGTALLTSGYTSKKPELVLMPRQLQPLHRQHHRRRIAE